MEGTTLFQKHTQMSKSGPEQSETLALTPCKQQHCCINSVLGAFLLLLLIFSFLFHFIDIHDCQMAQRLIAHIEMIMCQDVPQQAEGLPQWPTVNYLLYSWLSPCSL